MDRRRLVLQPMLQLVHDEFAVFFFLDQALGDLALLRDDGPVVLDPPYRETGNSPENQQECHSGGIGHVVTEIDANAERASRNRGRNPGPEAAERGGKEHRRKIWRKEHVGTDLGQSPPRDGCQSQTADGKASAEQRGGLGDSLPAAPEFLDQFRHRFCHFT